MHPQFSFFTYKKYLVKRRLDLQFMDYSQRILDGRFVSPHNSEDYSQLEQRNTHLMDELLRRYGPDQLYIINDMKNVDRCAYSQSELAVFKIVSILPHYRFTPGERNYRMNKAFSCILYWPKIGDPEYHSLYPSSMYKDFRAWRDGWNAALPLLEENTEFLIETGLLYNKRRIAPFEQIQPIVVSTAEASTLTINQ